MVDLLLAAGATIGNYFISSKVDSSIYMHTHAHKHTHIHANKLTNKRQTHTQIHVLSMFPVDARDIYMVTPLLFCIRSGQAAIAKHLLNKGASILASDRNVSSIVSFLRSMDSAGYLIRHSQLS